MNRTRNIDDLETWKVAKVYLKEHGFYLFQFQFDVEDHEGFQARFSSKDYEDILIITFSEEIRDRIIKFKGRG